MALNNTLLTNFLDEFNIHYQEDDESVSFEYDGRVFLGAIRQLPVFDGALNLMLPKIQEISTAETEQYLKIINKLNYEAVVVKYMLDEEYNVIDVIAEVPLDSSPELDDLVPGLIKLLLEAHNQFNAALQQ
jgi:hypothetical protein